ncbi:isoprenyl transferase [candidate division WOR-3 bacterium]|uniref:Isoprenyl transferase n=1 Tax=candidate division WOR-3 bacterium TaxID=2052148 RepID=A0A660SDG5_UNCW3|nr:MAG: isoprenyl transferase [candidate division WOR-3 bacterium]
MAELKIPKHIAIIMDGNGRWARKRGLPRMVGHKAGVESVREIVRVCGELGVEYLTLYTFSTENWQRPEGEVRFLMDMLKDLLIREVPELNRNNVRLNVIGRLDILPDDIRERIDWAIHTLSQNTGLKLILAISYGGRAEIVDAIRRIVKEGVSVDRIDEESLRKYFYDPKLPDPDLLIRTGARGRIRISNFLIYQSAYAELYFTETLWPDFRKEELIKAIEDYTRRERRFGRVLE